MMCMISPSNDAFAESISTLKFANRAKNIRNRAEVNEDLDHRTLLRKYERELKHLRGELHTRSKQLVDKRHLLQARTRADASSMPAHACPPSPRSLSAAGRAVARSWTSSAGRPKRTSWRP